MNDSVQIVIAIVLYLCLFAWIGYRRGSLRELIVLVVTLGGYLLLREYRNIVITLINLFGKFFAFSQAGGLSGSNPDAILLIRDAPDVIPAAQAETVIFILWAIVLLIAYWATGRFVRSGRNRSDFSAMLLGVLNGIFYFSIFLPLLASIFLPEVVSGAIAPEAGASLVLRNSWQVLGNSFASFWVAVDDQQPLVVVLLLTVTLVAVAGTLRSSSAKS